MLSIAIPFLIAGFLHIFCAGIAKFGAQGFDNHNPRQWMSTFSGYRARANAAQANTIESLPFFFGATLFALYMQTELNVLACLMWIWVVLRFIYIFCYVKDFAGMRSLVWFAALLINSVILFSPVIFSATE